MNLASLLRNAASHSPHAPALAIGARMYCTYAEPYLRTTRLAGALSQQFGLARGSRVGLAMTNYGKVLKTELREVLARTSSAPS